MGRFTGKVVLVTGALGGIGSATARRFAAEGALLALTDIGKTADDVPAALVAGAADWDSWPTGWAFWPADLSKPADVDTLFTEVLERFGRLDVLVNVAGYDHDNGVPLEKLTLERLHRNLDTNLASCLLCCQSAVTLMKPQKSGVIVNMSSLTWRGSQQQFTYSASKGGVYALTRSLATTSRPLEAFDRQSLRTALVVIFLGILATARVARASSIGISNKDIVSFVKVMARESFRIDL